MSALGKIPLSGLRTLLAVARHNNIGKAAATLGVSPGAVSHQMRKLEDRLGIALLDRHGPRIALTASARRVIPALALGFAGLQDAHLALLAADPRAPFKISVDTSFASVWLMPRLPDLRHLLDGRDVGIVPLDHSVGDRAIIQADLAITYRNIGDDTGALAVRHLMTDRMVALVEKSLAATLTAPRSADTVAGLPLIEVDPAMGDALYPRWPDWFQAAGRTLPDGAVKTRVGLSHMAMQAAAEGLGVALVPQSVSDGLARKLGLVEIGQDAPGLTLTRRLIWQRDAPQGRSTEAVVAALLGTVDATTDMGGLTTVARKSA